jgi:hypothetical protein
MSLTANRYGLASYKQHIEYRNTSVQFFKDMVNEPAEFRYHCLEWDCIDQERNHMAVKYSMMNLFEYLADPMKSFDTEQQARDWMVKEVDDQYGGITNYRFAFISDVEACFNYDVEKSNGCCGTFDKVVIVNGKEAHIGCNYGH